MRVGRVTEQIKAPFPYFGDAMAYAMTMTEGFGEQPNTVAGWEYGNTSRRVAQKTRAVRVIFG